MSGLSNIHSGGGQSKVARFCQIEHQVVVEVIKGTGKHMIASNIWSKSASKKSTTKRDGSGWKRLGRAISLMFEIRGVLGFRGRLFGC
jgi:hypothetical protein